MDEQILRKLPVVSIITPFYNREDLLPRMIQSVLNQSYSLWELILMDDGSNDRSREVIQQYKDKRIKYYYGENSGAADKRNEGVKNSKGEYIIFLDSDDEVYPNWLQQLIAKIEVDNPDLVSCGWERVDNENRFFKKGLPKCLGPMFNNITASFLSGTLLMTRQIFEESGGYDAELESAQHTDLMLRLIAAKGGQLHVETVPEYLLIIHDHHGSKIRKNYQAVLNGTIRMLKKHPEVFQRNRNDHFDFLSVAGVSAMKIGRTDLAKNYFQQAFKVKPFQLKNLLRLTVVHTPFLSRLIWRGKELNPIKLQQN